MCGADADADPDADAALDWEARHRAEMHAVLRMWSAAHWRRPGRWADDAELEDEEDEDEGG